MCHTEEKKKKCYCVLVSPKINWWWEINCSKLKSVSATKNGLKKASADRRTGPRAAYMMWCDGCWRKGGQEAGTQKSIKIDWRGWMAEKTGYFFTPLYKLWHVVVFLFWLVKLWLCWRGHHIAPREQTISCRRPRSVQESSWSALEDMPQCLEV